MMGTTDEEAEAVVEADTRGEGAPVGASTAPGLEAILLVPSACEVEIKDSCADEGVEEIEKNSDSEIGSEALVPDATAEEELADPASLDVVSGKAGNGEPVNVISDGESEAVVVALADALLSVMAGVEVAEEVAVGTSERVLLAEILEALGRGCRGRPQLLCPCLCPPCACAEVVPRTVKIEKRVMANCILGKERVRSD